MNFLDPEKIQTIAQRFNSRASAKGWQAHFDPTLTFFRPQLTEMLAVWREKAKDGLPARSSFDPRSLKNVMSNMLIVERIETDGARSWRFRYFGSELVRLLGEFTNQPLEEALPLEHAERWNFVYDCVSEGLGPARVVASNQLAKIDYLDGEGLLLPLANEKGDAHLVLSATYVRPKVAP